MKKHNLFPVKPFLLVIMCLLSLSVLGQTPIFSNATVVRQNGLQPLDAVTDANGNTFVIGIFSGDPDFDPGTAVVKAPDPFNYKAADSYRDGFIAKYDSQGGLSWVKAMWTRGDITGEQQGTSDPNLFLRDITIDAAGNVYFIGDIIGEADGIGNQVSGTHWVNGARTRAFVRGIRSNGTVFYEAENDEPVILSSTTGEGIDVDASGNVYITGDFREEVNGFTVARSDQRQTYFAKFNASGTRVDQGWPVVSATSTYAASRDNVGRAIAVDGTGNIFIAGYFGQNASFDGGTTTIDAVNSTDLYVASYDANKDFVGVKTYDLGGLIKSIDVDPSGNLYGAFGNHIVKINASGNKEWERDFTYPVDFAMNSNNELLVTRLEGGLRFLKLGSNNSIGIDVAPLGGETTGQGLVIQEYAPNLYSWVITNGSADFDNDEGTARIGVGPIDGFIRVNYASAVAGPPTIVSFSPVDDATGVALDADLTVTFNEPIEAKDAFVRVKRVSDNRSILAGRPEFETNQFTILGSTMIIHLANHNGQDDPLADTEYYVEILNGAVTDIAGNPFAGFTDNATWNFTTAASTPSNSAPTDIALSPASIDENNGINAVIGTLSTTDADAGDTHTYSLITGTGSTDNGSFNINNDQLRASVAFDFEAKSSYTIQVQTNDGNDTFQEQFTITVNDVTETTPDTDPPTKVSFSPEDDATNVPVDASFVATFDKDLELPASGLSVVIAKEGINELSYTRNSPELSLSGSVITIDPSVDLLPNTNYNIYLNSGITDLSGNSIGSSFNDATTWNFTTAASTTDTDPPVGESVSPVDEGNFAYLEKAFYINFNEDVQLGTGTVSLFLANGTLAEEIPVSPTNTDPRVYIHANQRAFYYNFDTVLEELTAYYVTITAGAVQDLNGNDYAGLGIGDLDFTTNARPNLDIQSPAHEATDVSVNPTIEFSFEEDIDVLVEGTEIALREYDTDNLVESFDIYTDRGSNGFDGFIDATQTISITPSVSLQENTKYYLRVEPAEALQEIEYFRQFDTKDGWSFTTQVAEEVVNIPDNNFKSYLVGNNTINSNGDAEIQVSEAEAFTGEIAARNQGILDATGIEAFINLTELELIENPINTIDLSQNTALFRLNMNSCSLTEISLSANTLLKFVNLGANDISTIDLSNNDRIISLDISLNKLTTIDLSNNSLIVDILLRNNSIESFSINGLANLGTVDIRNNVLTSVSITNTGSIVDAIRLEGNNITSADFSGTDVRNILAISGNPQLSGLDVSGMISLKSLRASNSSLSSLDLSSNTQLTEIEVNGANLSSLNLKNGNNTALSTFSALNNANLSCIDVDDVTYFESNFSGNVNAGVSFSTDCSADITPPQVVSFSPEDDATGVAVDVGTLTINFNEAVRLESNPGVEGTDYFLELRNADINDVTKKFDLSSLDAEFTGSSIILKNVPTLENSTNYNIRYYGFPTQPIEDLSANKLASFNNTTTWNFTTVADTDPPKIVSFSPADDATNVPVDASFVATFDEPIAIFPGENQAVGLYKDGLAQFFIPEGDARLSISGNVLTINFTDDLLPNTNYSIWVRNLSDLNENYINTFNNSTTWNFKTRAAVPVNEAPTAIALSAGSIDENNAVGDVIGAFSTKDSDFGDTHTYTLVAGTGDTDNASFSIDGENLKAAEVFDFETKSSYSIRVQTDDGSDTFQEQITIFINSETETDTDGPQLVSLSPADGATNVPVDVNFKATFDEPIAFFPGDNQAVGLYKDGVLQFFIPEGDARLTLSSNLLTINFTDDLLPNTNYSIWIQGVSDLNENYNTTLNSTTTWNFKTRAVVPINEAPTAIALGQSSIDENNAVGDVIGAFSTEDTDFGATHTYELVAGSGDTDNDSFTITEGNLEAGVVFDFETKSSYSIRVQTNDGNGGTFQQAFTITVNDVQLDQTITFTGITDKTFGDPSFDLSASASSGLTVSYNVTSGPASVSGNTVTITGAGAVTIEATQSGDDDYNLATPVSQTFTVEKGQPVITIEAIETKFADSPDFDIVVSADNDAAPTLSLTGPATRTGTTISLDGSTGTVTITAELTETANYLAATATETFEVLPARQDQSITFAALDAVTFGDADFDLTATASSNLAVTYSSSDETVATINGSTVKIVGAGTTTITASQAGDDSFKPAADVTQDLVVNKADQTITINAIDDKLITDAAFDVVASTTSNLELVYTIISGPATNVGSTITLNGTTGTVVVEVSQAGNDNYESASATESFNVSDPSKTDQTITFDALEAKTFGDAAFDLTATASSNLAVSYASSNQAVATVNGNTVTIVGAGSTTITASQEGDNDFNSAAPVQQELIVTKADQTISINAIDDKLITDAAFDVVATTTSNLELTYTIVSGPATNDGSVITLNGTTGTVLVEVSQAGSDNYESASTTESFNVNDPSKTDQTITFAALDAVTFGDEAFDLTATTSSNLAVSYASSNQAVATVNGNTVTIVGAGSTTITASQEGDDDFNAAVPVQRELIVSKAEQTITINAIDDKLITDAAFDVVATTTSNLELTYTIVSGPATNDGSTITLDGTTGTVVVEVSQAGNDDYESASVTESFNVSDPGKTDQTITFDPITDVTYGDVVTLSATASSTLPVSFTVVSGPATLNGDELTFSEIGEVTVEASQQGDTDFNPAPVETQTFEVKAAELAVVADDQSITFGEAIPELTYTISGFVNGETDEVLTSAPSTSTAAEAGSDAGTYPITIDGAAADNYVVTYTEGTLTINKATATITISDLEQQADGSPKEVTVTTDPAGLSFTVTYDGDATAPSAAGSYEVVVTVDDINYEGSTTETLVLSEEEDVLATSKEVSIRIYPNPFTDQIHVSGEDIQQILLYDNRGQIIRKSAGDSADWKLENLTSGVYFIRIMMTDKRSEVRKIIRQ